MAKRKGPRKPSQPLGHIVFPKHGRPHHVVETLPESKEDLEAAVVGKFIGALWHFEGRVLAPPTHTGQWPDFETQEENVRVGIEVVEVVNVEHARKRHLQEQYRSRVVELVAKTLPRLRGLWIRLHDGYQDPPYPPIRSRAGKQLAQSIADSLHSVVDELEKMALGRLRVYKWQERATTPSSGAIVKRFAPRDAGVAAIISYLGSFPVSVTITESLLSRAIEGKLEKSYPSYSGGRLWLLAYEVGYPSVHPKPSASAAIAKSLLQQGAHPFDEVWYIFPYAHKDLGSIERVWP